MSGASAEQIADAIMYEGYLLFPYRARALKNQRRWTFGGLSPRGSPDPSALECETVIQGSTPRVSVVLRFLDGEGVRSERRVEAGPFVLVELLVGASHGFKLGAAAGLISLCATPDGDVHRLMLGVENTSEHATLHAAHALIRADGGAFVSVIDPPDALAAAVSRCHNERTWPLLVGDPAARDTVLCSPIIMDDFPSVAPESPGDLFDCTENDELLTLAILSLTDDEKREMAASDPRAAKLLARTERLSREDHARLHGAIRAFEPVPPRAISVGGRSLAVSDKVRLEPKARADIFDLALAGRVATILSIEQDSEGRTYVTVTVDDDPGKDFARDAAGHRFFFYPDELAPLDLPP